MTKKSTSKTKMITTPGPIKMPKLVSEKDREKKTTKKK